jgi:hypothetical protein
MAKPFLINSDTIKQRLQQRYRANRRRWLEGADAWPLSIPLGIPTERQARNHLADVQAWQARWHAWRGEGEIVWTERRWSGLGTQKLPERMVLHNPKQVAIWIGEAERWQRATGRYALMTDRWPLLAGTLSNYFDELADYSEEDFQRLVAMLKWLEAHPDSRLYIRQLPVAGVHTKWLLARKALITSLLRPIRAAHADDTDFYSLTGIRREPVLIHLRLLDSEARRAVGGLGDITASVEDVARLQLPVHRVYIVENLQTGLAFGKLPGAAVFMRLGYAVDLFGEIPWLGQLPCYYWGDLDTHGFAILNRLRHYLPHARSLLMDEATLLAHQGLWGQERAPVNGAELPLLTNDEQLLYRDLCNNRWGTRLRLEQERIPWEYAWERLCDVRDSKI